MDVRQVSGGSPVRTLRTEDPLSDGASLVVVVVVVLFAVVGATLTLRRRRRTIARLLIGSSRVHGVDPARVRSIGVLTSSELLVPLALAGREVWIPPGTMTTLPPDQREAVLLHEIAHVERRDPQWIDASRFLCAMTRWQPLNRRVLDALERDTELAADGHAVRIGASPRALVAALAYFASRADGSLTFAGAQLVRGDSPLVNRARRLLNGVGHATSVRAAIAAATCIAIATAILVALPLATPVRAANPAADASPGRAGRTFEVHEIDVRRAGQPR